MATKSDLSDPANSADLVAYLDGELPAPRAQELARQAARDEATRREVEALRETWGLLDLLPRARVTEDFGTKTLTALRNSEAPDADPDPDPDVMPGAARRRWRAGGLAAVALMAAVIGYAITGRAWPDRDARLVRQLALAEHLDEYRAVGSAEFLRLLDESDLFDDAE